MTTTNEPGPSFNLWTEPWITLQQRDGTLVQRSIQQALHEAPHYAAIHDPSPLVVVGIHRLLVAILQAALNPQENADLNDLWDAGEFPPQKLDAFAARYADRFDLFSPDKPFLQSADLPLFPASKEDLKGRTSVARLFAETPSGTEVTHYRHATEDDCVLCPGEAAKGLVMMPAFMSSGGPGLMPSINGVPPIYVIPGGESLFQSLAASLIKPIYFPAGAAVHQDLPWWERSTPTVVIESKKGADTQFNTVGYLHGLTFPARKVRLHPERLHQTCTRSGQNSEWCVRTMAFRMGESRADDAPWWRDPFAAYKLPAPPKQKPGKAASKVKAKEQPKPIRPTQSKVAWREFVGLFLQGSNGQEAAQQTARPSFLGQWSELDVAAQYATYPFRCVAIQTDGKAKNFEWLDFGFDVPPALLQDPTGTLYAERALDFAAQCDRAITGVFERTFGQKAKSRERFQRLKTRMDANFWNELASEFRAFILRMGQADAQAATFQGWLDTTQAAARHAFERAADETPDDGSTLRLRVEGQLRCAGELKALRAKIEHATGVKP